MVTVVLSLMIAFSADWRLTLVVLGTAPLIAIGGYIDMKAMQGVSNTSKTSLESVTAAHTYSHRSWWARILPGTPLGVLYRLATLLPTLCVVCAPLQPLISVLHFLGSTVSVHVQQCGAMLFP